MFCFRQQLFYLTELNLKSGTKSCYSRATGTERGSLAQKHAEM